MTNPPRQIEEAVPRTEADGVATVDLIDPTLRVTVPVKRRVRLREVWTTLPVGRMVGYRDMKTKYKQSALGPLWLVLQPLGMLLAITIAFSRVTSVSTGSVPYIVFALVGLAVWTYVQMTINVAPMTLPANQPVVRRSPCPRLALVTGAMIAVLPPFAVVLTAAILGSAISVGLPIQALLMPVLAVWLLVFMWGFSLLAAALGARFRDAVAFAPLVVQAGIFLTPVGYPLSAAGSFDKVLAFNPASGLIEAWRWSLLGTAPYGFAIGVALAETVVFLFLGWYVFGRMETRFADYV